MTNRTAGATTAGTAATTDSQLAERDPRVATIHREVLYADLPDTTQRAIIEIALSAIEKFVLLPTRSTWRKEEGVRKELEREVERTCLREIAHFIKTNVDQQFGPSWHAIYGRNFATYVTHERMSMVHFSLDGAEVVVWKHGA